ncbi:hypothetical protein GQ42DRAFT_163346 [Ramicandelaber brevisporus]|nr:hypothetical protein GQ42DRAFT_163346 [Ramicandelaber brevisporus]
MQITTTATVTETATAAAAAAAAAEVLADQGPTAAETPFNLLSLPDELLLIVLDFMTLSDAYSVLLTCSYLFPLGIRRLYRTSPPISSPTLVRMLTEHGSVVRTLTLYRGITELRLQSILELCPNVRELIVNVSHRTSHTAGSMGKDGLQNQELVKMLQSGRLRRFEYAFQGYNVSSIEELKDVMAATSKTGVRRIQLVFDSSLSTTDTLDFFVQLTPMESIGDSVHSFTKNKPKEDTLAILRAVSERHALTLHDFSVHPVGCRSIEEVGEFMQASTGGCVFPHVWKLSLDFSTFQSKGPIHERSKDIIKTQAAVAMATFSRSSFPALTHLVVRGKTTYSVQAMAMVDCLMSMHRDKLNDCEFYDLPGFSNVQETFTGPYLGLKKLKIVASSRLSLHSYLALAPNLVEFTAEVPLLSNAVLSMESPEQAAKTLEKAGTRTQRLRAQHRQAVNGISQNTDGILGKSLAVLTLIGNWTLTYPVFCRVMALPSLVTLDLGGTITGYLPRSKDAIGSPLERMKNVTIALSSLTDRHQAEKVVAILKQIVDAGSRLEHLFLRHSVLPKQSMAEIQSYCAERNVNFKYQRKSKPL